MRCVSVDFSAEVMEVLLIPKFPIRGLDLCLGAVKTWEYKERCKLQCPVSNDIEQICILKDT